jgi:RHS repeat-associated protein
MSPAGFVPVLFAQSSRKKHATRYVIVVVAFLSYFLHGKTADAQTPQDSTIITPNTVTGVQPYGTYDGVNENINLSNGNVNFHLPLLSLPQRAGRKFEIGIEIDSKTWALNIAYLGPQSYDAVWQQDQRVPLVAPNIRLSVPTLQTTGGLSTTFPYCRLNWIFTSGDGSKHTFNSLCVNPKDTTRDATDASFIRLDLRNPNDVVVRLKDGTAIHFLGFVNTTVGGIPVQYYELQPFDSIVDTNGNMITATKSNGVLTAITDTVGRVFNFNLTNSSISYHDANGAARQIAFTSVTPLTQGGPITFVHPVPNECTLPNQTTSNSQSEGTGNSAWTVAIPNGASGLTYRFDFDALGELLRVGYPSGGYTRYEYQAYESAWNPSQHTNCSAVDTRQIVAKHECRRPDGNCTAQTTPEDTTTYQASAIVNLNNGIMDVFSPDPSGTTNKTRHVTAAGVWPNYAARETDVYIYSGLSTLLRTVHTDYTLCYSAVYDNSLPIRVTTTLNDVTPNLVSKVETDYQPMPAGFNTLQACSPGSLDNPTEIREYDYGLVLARTTDYTWLTGSSYDIAQLHIMDRKLTTTVSAGGSQASQSSNEYDSYTQGLTTSGATQHQSMTTARGNVTAVSRWLNTTGTQLTTRFQFDDAGNIRMITDPLQNSTTISFVDNWQDATCAPVSGQAAAYPKTITNALGQQTTMKYNSCFGLLAAGTDPNLQQTAYAYDTLGRLSSVGYPDGGSVTEIYNDTAPISISRAKKISSTASLTNLEVYDGLGRVTQTQLTSDPDGTTYTVTAYDSLGRIGQVYDPTRCNPPTSNCGESTWGFTLYTYDALGRTTKVTNPDNSTVLTTYTGRATQVQDEGNGSSRVTRISQSDALGRLLSLCEVSSISLIGPGGTPGACGQDIAGTGFLTSYQYSALDSLTSVTMSGLNPRTFIYDSLSRLTSATNPESGQVCYGTVSGGTCQANGYDADGNLVAKTDARRIQTTYSYDALNRLTGKTYSDGTPAATFNYDKSSALGVSLINTVGRKSSQSTAGTNATGSVFSYDTMGRISDNSQCTPQNCGTGVFAFQYTQYDFVGDLISATNAVGISFNYAYNAVARLTGITTNFIDSSHPGTLYSNARYSPFGALTSATLGNGITESWSYNNRLWQQSRTEKFGTTTAYSFSVPAFAPDGNILTANDSANGNWSYNYDPLSRLLSANATGQAYTYDYDRFGNRWHQNGPHSSQLGFDANNRITGVTGVGYDAAGNLTSDGSGPGTHAYFYDAENRLIQVDGTLGTCSTATACYVYNAEGQRVRKTASGSSTDYLYDLAGHKIADVDPTGVFMQGELYTGSRHFATYAPEPGPTGATFFTHSDSLGTERVRTDMTGASCESIASLPFGDGQSITGTCGDVSPLHFTGKERDPETGLDNFGARYDSSSMGRFISPDPMGGHLEDPQTLNKYAYVRNNPTTLTDPTGLDIWLQGCGKENTGTCQNNYVGTTDKDGNFTRTHLTGNQTQDATLGAHGISVTQDGKTYEGVWDTNKGENGAVTVAGAKDTPLEGYDATINGNCGNTCVASGTIFNASNPNASTAALFSVLDAKGSGYVKEAGLDFMDKFHPGATNFRGHSDSDPHGTPSTHIPIDPTASTPQLGFHVDRSFPYDDLVDFAGHTGSVIHTLWNRITGQQ